MCTDITVPLTRSFSKDGALMKVFCLLTHLGLMNVHIFNKTNHFGTVKTQHVLRES